MIKFIIKLAILIGIAIGLIFVIGFLKEKANAQEIKRIGEWKANQVDTLANNKLLFRFITGSKDFYFEKEYNADGSIKEIRGISGKDTASFIYDNFSDYYGYVDKEKGVYIDSLKSNSGKVIFKKGIIEVKDDTTIIDNFTKKEITIEKHAIIKTSGGGKLIVSNIKAFDINKNLIKVTGLKKDKNSLMIETEVPVSYYDPTYSWQPDSASAKDAWVGTNAKTTNYGFTSPLYVGTNTVDTFRVFIDFKNFISDSIPAGHSIDSAIIKMYNYSGSGICTTYIARPTAGWVSQGITWDTQPSVSSPYSDTVRVADGVADAYVQYKVTSLVNSYYDGTYEDSLGFAITHNQKKQATNNYLAFASAEYGTANQRPQILIYTTPLPKKAYVVFRSSINKGWLNIDSINNNANGNTTDSISFLTTWNGLWFRDGSHTQKFQLDRVFYSLTAFDGDSIPIPNNDTLVIRTWTKDNLGHSITDTIQYYIPATKRNITFDTLFAQDGTYKIYRIDPYLIYNRNGTLDTLNTSAGGMASQSWVSETISDTIQIIFDDSVFVRYYDFIDNKEKVKKVKVRKP